MSARDRLAELYPGTWALALIKLCSPTEPHHHGERPCTSPGKVPVDGPDWQRRAVDRWEDPTAHPGRLDEIAHHVDSGGNVGLTIPPGFIVLDCDTTNAERFILGSTQGLDVPQQTTRQGRHFLFALPQTPNRWRATKGLKLTEAVAVDLQMAGRSQIVVEPSVHELGTLYAWQSAIHGEPDALPPHLVQMISAAFELKDAERDRQHRVDRGAGSGRLPPLPQLVAGSRHDTLFRFATSAWGRGVDPDALLEAMLEARAQGDCHDFPESEVRDLWRDVTTRYPHGPSTPPGGAQAAPALEPEHLPDAPPHEDSDRLDPGPLEVVSGPIEASEGGNDDAWGAMDMRLVYGDQTAPFPVEALPDWVAAMVEEVADRTQTDPAIAAQLGIGALSAAAARKFEVSGPYTQPVVLYLAAVAESGEGKSPVAGHMFAPILRYETDRQEREEAEVAEAQQNFRVREARIKHLEGLLVKDGDNPQVRAELRGLRDQRTEEPRIRQPFLMVQQDFTGPSLAQDLLDQGETMALLSGEGIAILRSIAGDSNQGHMDAGLFLCAHSREKLTVRRKSAASATLHAPQLTVAMGIQPQALAGTRHTEALEYLGAYARIVYAYPDPMMGRRTTARRTKLDEATAAEYDRRLRQILEVLETRDSRGRLTQRGVELGDAAHTAHVELSQEIEYGLGDEGKHHDVRAYWAKIEPQIVRLAALLHLAHIDGLTHHTHIPPIPVERMREACTIGMCWLNHAKKVRGSLHGEGSGVYDTLRFLKKHARGGVISKTEVNRRVSTRRRHLMEWHIERLETAGCLRTVRKKLGQSHKPSVVFELHPGLLEE